MAINELYSPAHSILTTDMESVHHNIRYKDFEDEVKGVKTRLFRLHNANGMEVLITNFGARIVSIHVPDKNGAFDDVVLGFDNLRAYRGEMDQAFGATIGRYANRIGGATFRMGGKEYLLEKNEGDNTLHSGSASWMHRAWEVASVSEGHLTLLHFSHDGEGGFPGAIEASVTFSLSDDNVLRIVFNAEAAEPTVVNMTNHSYFNLAGENSGDVSNHLVRIHAREITQTDEALIPTGSMQSVDDTPLDLRDWRVISEGLNSDDPTIKAANGFDFNYVLDQSAIDPDGLTLAAEVYEPASKRLLEVWTSQPGLQFYTGNWIHDGIKGKSGQAYVKRAGLCLETQHFPDSPNQPAFPGVIVDDEHPYHHVCEYRFGLRNA